MIISKKTNLIFLLFLLITGLIIYRGPCFLTEGVFGRDEYAFYKFAKDYGFLKGLFFVYEGASYLKLWTNIANSVASFYSFETAKLITTYFSVVVYYVIFSYILFFNSELFLTNKHKIFAIFIVLLSPGMTPEIWMGSAHIREYFGIFAFILLFYNPKNDTNFKKLFSNILILISFLSSIWATVLSPIYFLKYFFNRNKDNFFLFLSSFIGSLIQFFIVINYHFLKTVGTDSRFQIEPEKIFSFIYNVPVRSFFGSTIPKFLFLKTDLYMLKFFNLFVILAFIGLTIFFLIYIFKKKDFLLNLIFISFILMSMFAMAGALTPNFVGGRYAVLPSIILIFLVFRIFLIENNLILKNFCGILLISSLLIGLVEFRYKSPVPQLLSCKYYELQNIN